MKPEDSTQISATARDRRIDQRRRTAGKVQLSIDATSLAGEMDNVSQSGVLFFTDADLHVTVQFESDGKQVVRAGRLVRAQRVRADHVGWAIEFD
ncbi:MAG: PilZ domain-containing protein [Planctomycetes bacterium]|nr:PilZ domain-containing protein [Planctomycetota bacterium]